MRCLFVIKLNSIWQEIQDSNLCMSESKSDALPTWRISIRIWQLVATPTFAFTRMSLQTSHYRLFQRTVNFFTKPKPCYITILKHTMPRSEPGLLVMCFNMVPRVRLELTHLSTLEPKSSAATNYATEAKIFKLHREGARSWCAVPVVSQRRTKS